MKIEAALSRRDFLAGAGWTAAGALTASTAKPNVVVFYIDDMGYSEPGCYGGKLAPTPNMDRLAANGVRFTDGYVSACVCGPSRVGLVTGRYQARTGHDANGNAHNGGELDIGETTIAQYLKRAGYATGIAGKWHLGAKDPKYLPLARGFDYAVGSVDNLGERGGPSFYRGSTLVETLPGAPVTTPFYTSEALRFIESHRGQPFFVYIPLNAVHAPHVASEKSMARFGHIKDARMRAYAAQVGDVDDAIGAVVAKLQDLKLEDDTIVFCISDNGGAGPADVGGLRGGKWDIFEGGIRVPFLMQWKRRIQPGQISREPVIQLDVLPTVLAAAGGTVKPDRELDGVNLLPLVEGKATSLNREALFWRFGVQAAVRQGNWKMLKLSEQSRPMLFNVAADMKESNDRATAEPARTQTMLDLWRKWNAGMKPPRWEDRRWYRGEEGLGTKAAPRKPKRERAKKR